MSTFRPKPGKHKPTFRIKQVTIGERTMYYPQVKLGIFSEWQYIRHDTGCHISMWEPIELPTEEEARQCINDYITATESQKPKVKYIYL